MDRGIYAPVRIELCAINPPYDRIQATDIIDWNGDPNHPGVLRLLRRIDELLPKPLTRFERFERWSRSRIATISAITFGLLALSILMWQTLAGQKQLAQMTALVDQQKTVAADLKAMRAGQDVLLPRIVSKFSKITAFMTVRLPIKHPLVAEYFDKVNQPVESKFAGSFGLWPSSTGNAGDIEEKILRFVKTRTVPAAITIHNTTGNILQMELTPTAPYRSLEISPHALEVRYMDMPVTFRGALQSLSDIAGATLTIEYLPQATPLPDGASSDQLPEVQKNDEVFNEIQGGIDVSSLELIFDGQTYTFKNFTKQTASAPGELELTMTIPKDLKELQE